MNEIAYDLEIKTKFPIFQIFSTDQDNSMIKRNISNNYKEEKKIIKFLTKKKPILN